MSRPVIICDIDNTLLQSYDIYDEAYRITSNALFGKEFIMTRNPDGTPDRFFSERSNPEILHHRLSQLGIERRLLDDGEFFDTFDVNAAIAAEMYEPHVYTGVSEFLQRLTRANLVYALSSGTRFLQQTVLKNTRLARYFDLEKSLFCGEFDSKRSGIETIAEAIEGTDVVAHFGDAPADMRAMKDADIAARKMAIGTTVSNRISSDKLLQAGADLVMLDYSKVHQQKVIQLLFT